MPVEITEHLIPLIIFYIFLGGMGLAGFKSWLNYRARKTGSIDPADVEHLTEAVDNLRQQAELLRGEFSELYERVEFTERMLSRGRTEDHNGQVASGERESRIGNRNR